MSRSSPAPILVGLLIDRLGLGYAGGIGTWIAVLAMATILFMLTVKGAAAREWSRGP